MRFRVTTERVDAAIPADLYPLPLPVRARVTTYLEQTGKAHLTARQMRRVRRKRRRDLDRLSR